MQIVSKREIATWDSRHRKGGKPSASVADPEGDGQRWTVEGMAH